MADVYAYRVEVLQSKPMDLTDYEVEATDGSIGKIDEATNDSAAGSCLVVDTGFWIFGKKRMIPAGVVRHIDPDDHKVYVAMTKDQIKNAPDYEPDRHRQDERGYHAEQRDYYRPYSS